MPVLEPFEEEEARQAKWDRKCDAAPRFHKCNGSIYPHETYLEIEGMTFCEPCVAYGTKFVDELEV